MPTNRPLIEHPWSLTWLRIKLVVSLMRFFAVPAQKWVGSIKRRMLPSDIQISYLRIPSREEGRFIHSYVYRPSNLSVDAKVPVHINWHGSGFVLPSLNSDVEFCYFIAKTLNMVVIDADYRKAPEAPFPSQTNDAEDAAAYVLSQSNKFDVSKVSIGGFSAGGNLALSTSSVFGSKLSAVACIYPKVNFSIPRGTNKAPNPKMRSGVHLHPFISRYFDASYLLNEEDRSNFKASPCFADTASFPSIVFVTTGDADVLYNEGAKFIEKLKEEGHEDSSFLNLEGEGHGFDKMPRNDLSKKRKKEAYEAVAAAIKRGHTK